jgi:ribokinase
MISSKPVPSPQVAILGAAAMDWMACVKEMPPKDGIVYADQYIPMPGGSGGNVAVGIARLGQGVRFMGVLGGDESGQKLLREFEEAGVETSAICIKPDERSASCFIALDEHGNRFIFSLGGAALYEKPEEIRSDWLAGVQVLFITDAYSEVAAAAMSCLDPKARVVFNPGGLMASAGEAYLEPFFRRADVLISSKIEAEAMSGASQVEKAVHGLARRGAGVVVVTLGEEGALILDHGKIDRVPALRVERVVDTTGAGDAFSSGLITGMLEGSNWTEAARLGCAVAAIKIGQLGARGGLPTRHQVREVMNEINISKEVMK